MSIDDLKVRDEVLQVMFWMLGENIAHEIDAGYIARFLSVPEDAIANALVVLARERLNDFALDFVDRAADVVQESDNGRCVVFKDRAQHAQIKRLGFHRPLPTACRALRRGI